MNIKYIIWSILAVLALTLAGCDTGPSTYIDKLVKQAKLLNEINGSVESAKLANEAIDKGVTSELKAQVESQMKKHCNPEQKEKLAKYESCFVDKLQVIKEKKETGAVSAAKVACKADFGDKIEGECKNAIAPLKNELGKHVAKPATYP